MDTKTDLSVFGDTEYQDFPLITIFGREPNDNVEKVHGIGPYAGEALEGQGWPSVGFWDKSYGLLGHYAGLRAGELKVNCIARRSSPIVITDFSPMSLDGRYTPAQKVKIRKTISVTEINEHVDCVLTHNSIFRRTDLVILSGLEDCGFHVDAIRHIEGELEKLDKPWCHITSLSNRNFTHAKRREQMAPFKPTINSVMNEFMEFEIPRGKTG